MKLLLSLLCLFFASCSLTGPETMKVTFPVTYIEWEVEHPQDTTWWTFCANGTLMSAWKRKLINSDGYLPIEYSVGTWSSDDGMRLTVAMNQVIPGSYNDLACDMLNPTYVTSQYTPKYVMYDFWRTDSLYGYQSYENGDTLRKNGNIQLIRFSKWPGQHLYEKTNPVFTNQYKTILNPDQTETSCYLIDGKNRTYSRFVNDSLSYLMIHYNDSIYVPLVWSPVKLICPN